jgi:hypothetical protein
MTVTINGTSGIAGVDGSAGTPAIQGADTNTGMFFPAADTIAFAEGGAEIARFDSSGNLGIGTSSPAYKLDVTGQGRATTGFAVSTDGSTFTPSGLNAIPNYGVGYITSTSQVALSGFAGIPFYTNQVERMRIDSSGNLLVGTTTSGGWSTAAKFEAYTTTGWGVSAYNNANGSGAFLGRVDNTAATLAAWYYGTTNVGSITTNGTTTTYGSISDYRLKEHVVPMTNALSILSQLNPVTYNWKSNGSGGQGFIAHELQAVVPDCVAGKKDEVNADGSPKYQSVDTSFLVATLTAAIKEQQALITALTARITALETK